MNQSLEISAFNAGFTAGAKYICEHLSEEQVLLLQEAERAEYISRSRAPEYDIVNWCDAPHDKKSWLEQRASDGWMLCAATEERFYFRREKSE